MSDLQIIYYSILFRVDVSSYLPIMRLLRKYIQGREIKIQMQMKECICREKERARERERERKLNKNVA